MVGAESSNGSNEYHIITVSFCYSPLQTEPLVQNNSNIFMFSFLLSVIQNI
jgi:hypothetical protein